MTPFLSRLRALDGAASSAPWWTEVDELATSQHETTMREFDPTYSVKFQSWSVHSKHGLFVANCGVHHQTEANAAFITFICNRAARIAAALEAAATLLSRNTVAVIDPAKCVDPGAWIAVLTKNFDALRAALAALDKEEA